MRSRARSIGAPHSANRQDWPLPSGRNCLSARRPLQLNPSDSSGCYFRNFVVSHRNGLLQWRQESDFHSSAGTGWWVWGWGLASLSAGARHGDDVFLPSFDDAAAATVQPSAEAIRQKPPCARLVGRVVRFDERRGFGFIEPSDGGPDIFFHRNDIVTLAKGFKQNLRPASRSVREVGSLDDDGARKRGWQMRNQGEAESGAAFSVFVGDKVSFDVVWSEEANAPRATMVEPFLLASTTERP